MKARAWCASTAEYWSLAWQEGDGDSATNTPVQPVAGSAFNELDLGLITVDVAETGDQVWSGQIVAYTSSTAGGETGAVDWLGLFPVNEGYGRLEGAYSYTPGVTDGYDDFSGASGALNGGTAVVGGTWATSGTTTDFAETTDALDAGNKTESRATVTESGPRFAILGSTSYTNCEVGVNVYFDPGTIGQREAYVVARFTDASNYARARILRNSTTQAWLFVETIVAGSRTSTLSPLFTLPLLSYMTLRLIVFVSGRALGWVFDSTGATLASLEMLSSVLATGGTLASGKSGFADESGSATGVRAYYDDFYAAVPSAETVIIRPGESLQVRSDANLRASSDGSTYGKLPSRGSRLWIPQAGDAGRSTRIAVRATREDPITTASRNDGDEITAELFYTPRYLAVPRG